MQFVDAQPATTIGIDLETWRRISQCRHSLCLAEREGEDREIHLFGLCDQTNNFTTVSFRPATNSYRGFGGNITLIWKDRAFCGIPIIDDGEGHSFLGFVESLLKYCFIGLAIYFATGIAINFYFSNGNYFDFALTLLRISNTSPTILA